MPELTERAEKEIVGHDFEHDDKPLFMYLDLPAPSMPTGEFAGKSKVPLYGDFVQRVEATVGRIMSVLDETGMRANMLLILSSDNGSVWYKSDETKCDHNFSPY